MPRRRGFDGLSRGQVDDQTRAGHVISPAHPRRAKSPWRAGVGDVLEFEPGPFPAVAVIRPLDPVVCPPNSQGAEKLPWRVAALDGAARVPRRSGSGRRASFARYRRNQRGIRTGWCRRSQDVVDGGRVDLADDQRLRLARVDSAVAPPPSHRVYLLNDLDHAELPLVGVPVLSRGRAYPPALCSPRRVPQRPCALSAGVPAGPVLLSVRRTRRPRASCRGQARPCGARSAGTGSATRYPRAGLGSPRPARRLPAARTLAKHCRAAPGCAATRQAERTGTRRG